MRYLSGIELRDEGVLLEVNRQLLHPRGLALEATIGKAESEDVKPVWMTQRGIDTVRQMVADLLESGASDMPEQWFDDLLERLTDAERLPADAAVLSIWETEDPEGVYFGEPPFKEERMDKAEAFASRLIERQAARSEALGFIVQPIGDAPIAG